MSDNEGDREYWRSSENNKRGQSSALEQRCQQLSCHSIQGPIVHYGRHFGRAIYAFCNVQSLIKNSFKHMVSDKPEESYTAEEHKQEAVYLELLKIIPRLEKDLMRENSSEEEIIHIADLV
ncbi:hypothetical protein SERLA73DRAFT_70002 [Serpula lacrymans var. lacrymans S7.3]|uniref:Uncharacterized protein n=2 Tax=Serpula lacrymans var. lacrymans TaxID=341189 RepID=F8PLL7_SERL3|nr:uncharacterized protein SERLADRAFT_434112 [Serpula lacrymans var. lacrymans S7.9]EGO02499.1 hypothetical protein SERLA73DRAFT_70002 [Serpula lacrymans var. lacrymans S7.3]EGO28241.1 hypothetical protein SERLADRAFT_434112 [Serpula lacrymans var. lacrymans S7.9]